MIAKNLTRMIVSALLIAGSSANAVFAQDKGSPPVDLTKLDCRTLLQMGGEDRKITLTFYHGLVRGINNQMIVDETTLMQTTDKVINYCIDNPQDTLLSVFQKYRAVK